MRQSDPVVLEDAVALGQRGLDLVGLRILAVKGEIEVLVVVGDIRPGALGQFVAVDRVVGDPDVVDHGRVLPRLVVQRAVEHGRRRDLDRFERADILAVAPLAASVLAARAAVAVPASSRIIIQKSTFFTWPPSVVASIPVRRKSGADGSKKSIGAEKCDQSSPGPCGRMTRGSGDLLGGGGQSPPGPLAPAVDAVLAQLLEQGGGFDAEHGGDVLLVALGQMQA